MCWCMTSIFHILYIQRSNLLVYCYWVCSDMPSYTRGTSKWWICIISNISGGKGLIFCMWVDDHKSNLSFFLNKRWHSWHFKSKLNNSRILPGRSSRTWTIYMFFIEIQVPLDLLLLIWICFVFLAFFGKDDTSSFYKKTEGFIRKKISQQFYFFTFFIKKMLRSGWWKGPHKITNLNKWLIYCLEWQ